MGLSPVEFERRYALSGWRLSTKPWAIHLYFEDGNEALRSGARSDDFCGVALYAPDAANSRRAVGSGVSCAIGRL